MKPLTYLIRYILVNTAALKVCNIFLKNRKHSFCIKFFKTNYIYLPYDSGSFD